MSVPTVLLGGPGDGRRQAVAVDALEQPPGELHFREALRVRELAAHVEQGAPYVPSRTARYRLQAVDGVPAVDRAGDLVYAWCGWLEPDGVGR